MNPSTGLPDLPAGYFWRVTRWNSESSSWNLQIKIRKRLLGGLFSWGVASTLTKSSPKIIERDAKYLAYEFYTKLDSRRERVEFLGDYPPKRLTIE